MTPIRCRAGKRIYVVALCFAILFAIPGVIIFMKSGDPALLVIVAVAMGLIFFNISMIRFECTESHIWYRSLLKNQSVSLDDIMDVWIGPVSVERRAPQLVLNTRKQGKIMLTVRVLPLDDVRRTACYLVERGIPFSVDPGIMSRRMASQIFPESTQESGRKPLES